MGSLLPHTAVGDILAWVLVIAFIGFMRIRAATAGQRKARHDEHHTIDEDGVEYRRLGPTQSPPRRIPPKGRA